MQNLQKFIHSLCNYTCLYKDDTDAAHYNINAHQPILSTFGRDVAKRERVLSNGNLLSHKSRIYLFTWKIFVVLLLVSIGHFSPQSANTCSNFTDRHRRISILHMLPNLNQLQNSRAGDDQRHKIFYLGSVRPIRTAEDFEAIDWATGFANKHGCILGLLKETGSVFVKVRT